MFLEKKTKKPTHLERYMHPRVNTSTVYSCQDKDAACVIASFNALNHSGVGTRVPCFLQMKTRAPRGWGLVWGRPEMGLPFGNSHRSLRPSPLVLRPCRGLRVTPLRCHFSAQTPRRCPMLGHLVVQQHVPSSSSGPRPEQVEAGS